MKFYNFLKKHLLYSEHKDSHGGRGRERGKRKLMHSNRWIPSLFAATMQKYILFSQDILSKYKMLKTLLIRAWIKHFLFAKSHYMQT